MADKTNPEPEIDPHVEDAVRAKLWAEHAKAYGLDAAELDDDAEIQAAPDFASLNKVLWRRAKDPKIVEQLWEAPAIQQRHQEAIKARETRTAEAKAADPAAELVGIFQSGRRPTSEEWDAYKRATNRPGNSGRPVSQPSSTGRGR